MKIDPDHKPIQTGQLDEREGAGGGWSQFEEWAGVTWFGDHEPYEERYGTIRSDTSKTSRFPLKEIESKDTNVNIASRNGTSIEHSHNASPDS